MRLKRLELWWHSLWIGILVRLMRRAPEGGPAWGARPHRVLFLRHDRAGDMILSTAVMRAIAGSHRTITLDVLASPANATIVAGESYIRDVIVFDKKRLGRYLATMRRLRRGQYDAVIDCMVTAPSVTTLLLVFATGARYRVGIAGRGNDAAFNVTVPANDAPGAHMVDLLAALARAFDVELEPAERRPTLTVRPAERERAELVWEARRGPRVLVNVSAGGADRVWPEARYAAVMAHLRERAPSAVFRVIASPTEADRGRGVAYAGGGEYVTTPSLRDALALVATADFVLTPDTSIAHAATAFQVPCVGLYFRGKAERWGVLGAFARSVEHHEPTLATLPAEPVLAAVDEVWTAAFTRG